MTDSQIDHEAVRLRVEKRLEPRLRLLRRRAWLFAHLLLFASIMFIYAADHRNGLFYYSEIINVPANAVPDGTGALITQPAWSYMEWHPYTIAGVIMAAWFLLVVVHTLAVWSAFRRERLIEQGIDREMELEKMRLQLDLARLNKLDNVNFETEKPKRVASLSEDGELVFEDEPLPQKVSRRRA